MKRIGIVLPVAIIVVLGVFLALFLGGGFEQNEEKVVNTSSLVDVVCKSNLSLVKHTYVGIAHTQFQDGNKTITCYIKYTAMIRPQINFKEIDFAIDHEAKTITPIIPEVTYDISISTDQLELIPSKLTFDGAAAYKIAEKDAMDKIMASGNLQEYERESLKNTLSALLLPITEPYGYKLLWAEL